MDMIKPTAEELPRHLFVAGFNHARVPLRLREKYTLSAEAQGRLLAEAGQCPPVRELVILNTCNRFELYAVTARLTWNPAEQIGHILRMIWPDMARADFEELVASAYWHVGEACVRHLCRTAASLDSMVVGEAEINGQVKDAYQRARAAGATGPVLNRLFQNAFTAAKRVRTETAVARGQVSVGTVAVREGFALTGPQVAHVLVCGAGRMATTIARHLRKSYPHALCVANRTLAHAEALAAEVQAEPLPLTHAGDAMAKADVVFAAGGGSDFLLTVAAVRAACALRKRPNPLVVVDVCLPRAVDPAIRELPGVCLLDLDDLQARVAAGTQQRLAELGLAEQLIEACTGAFWPRVRYALGQGPCPESAPRAGRSLLVGCVA